MAMGCGSSVGVVAPSGGACHGPGCTSTGDASTLAADTSTTIGSSQLDDGGTLWSSSCGPQSAGCNPDPDAGACDDIFGAVFGTDGGSDGGASGGAKVSLTCRVRKVADTYNIERACEGAGPEQFGDSCSRTLDCGAGLTCVKEGRGPVCRSYCCGDSESCPSDTYCATETTIISSAQSVEGADVPVCVQAEKCDLAEPYPCPQDQSCTCPAGKACSVVRRQGLTACVEPASGVQGEPCSCAAGREPCFCAAGYVCSNPTLTCLKLCQLTLSNAADSTTSVCKVGTSCQASNDLPGGWGVCVALPMLIVN